MDKLPQAHALLSSMKNNLPSNYEIDAKYVMQFHRIVDTLQETGIDLTNFRVPASDLHPETTGGNYLSGETYYSGRTVTLRSDLILKIDAVLSAISNTSPTENVENGWMRMAIEAAKKSKAEDNRPHPLVGAVVVRNDKLLGSGYRGYPELGDHAEEGLVEKRLRDTSVAGCTVYTTLEPCTTRGRLPCANILTEHKVARVVVGMLDPDQRITGKGILYLRKHGIAVDLFPTKMMAELEELNRDFIRNKEAESARLLASAEAISTGPFRSRVDLPEMALWPPAQAATDMLLIGHNLNAVFRQAQFFEQKLREGCRIRLLIADPRDDELLTVMSRGWWSTITRRRTSSRLLRRSATFVTDFRQQSTRKFNSRLLTTFRH